MSELGDALRIVSEHTDAIELNADSLPPSLQARPRQKAAALRVVIDAARRWEGVWDRRDDQEDLALVDEARRSGALKRAAMVLESYSGNLEGQDAALLRRLAASTEQEGTNDARTSHK